MNGGVNLKRSFIITVNNFLRKIAVFLGGVVLVLIFLNFGVINTAFNAMAKEAVFTEKKGSLTGFFLPKNEAIICMLTNSELKNTNTEIRTAVLKEKEENKKEEVREVPQVIENEPDNVNFSKEKSSISVTNNNIIVSNAAKKSFNIENLLSMPLSFKNNTDGYKVLVIHTHTTESYMPDDRNENPQKNITRVGEEIARVLNEQGIKTLHEKTVHDVPYSKSYINELASIEKILSEYPSVEVIIDVHRDALYNTKNEKIKPVTMIDGKKTAQVMFVCGTDAMGLPHDNWKNCFSFALKVQNKMNKTYPELARPINLREERFNTHKTKNSVILEVGANGNTLEEAILGGRYSALCIASVLKGEN